MAPGHPGQGPMMSGGPTLQQVTIGGGSGQQAGMGGPVAPQQQGQPGKRPGFYRRKQTGLKGVWSCSFNLVMFLDIIVIMSAGFKVYIQSLSALLSNKLTNKKLQRFFLLTLKEELWRFSLI